MAKLLKRVLYLDSENDIDFENLGNHFTRRMDYVHNGGGEKGFSNGKYIVCVCGFVEENRINEAATEFSNKNYPHESEVVTEKKSEIRITSIQVLTKKGYLLRKKRVNILANTGKRIDAWVKNEGF
jgi:hypothetical protein